jgi:hypothetical protein
MSLENENARNSTNLAALQALMAGNPAHRPTMKKAKSPKSGALFQQAVHPKNSGIRGVPRQT